MKRIGRYEVQAELGRGGFGQVFLAHDPTVGRAVAIKVLQAAEEPELLLRFRSEAAAAGKLRHRNIITIYDFGEQDHVPYLVMEYLEGEDLERIITRRRPLSVLQKLDIMAQSASGLHHAHVHGIVHRDIKPANVMLLADGTVKIMDFGIALLSQATAARITPQGSLVGTFHYMAPEQFYGAVSDALTDLFAYGVTCYKLLTGTHPFQAPEMAAMMHNIMNKQPAPIRALVPQCPEVLEDAVFKMLAKERDARYQSLEDVKFDLEPIIGELRKERVGELVTEARTLIDSGEFDGAHPLVREALEIDAGNRTARELREQLQRLIKERAVRPQIAALLDAGRHEMEAQHYDQAIKKFESALRLDKSNREIQDLIQRARGDWERQQRADRLVTEARHALDAGELTAANKGISDALAAFPEHGAAKSLLGDVRKKLETRQRETMLREGISRARGLMLLQSFDAAVGFLTQLHGEFPASAEIARLLADATIERDARLRQERLRAGTEEVKERIKNRQFSEAADLAGHLALEFPESKELTDLGSYAAEEERARKRAEVVSRVTAETSTLVEAGKFDEAINGLKSALEEHPTASSLRELLQSVTSAKSESARREALAQTRAKAAELIGKGSYARALDSITAFTTAYGDSAELDSLRRSAEDELQKQRRIASIRKLVLQAQGLMDEGRPDTASQVLQQATVQYPDDTDVTRLLGAAQDQLREQRRAQELSKVISEAESLTRKMQFDAALALIQKALDLDPSEARLSRCKDAVLAAKEAHRQEAIRAETKEKVKALWRDGQLEAALALLSSARPELAAKDPEFSELKKRIQSELQTKAREDEIRQTVLQAEALMAQGDLFAATKILKKAAGTYPSDPELTHLIGIADERKREQDRAGEIRRGVEQARGQRDAGNFEAAEKVLRAAIAKFPGETAVEDEIRLLAEAKHTRERQQKAARTRERARDLLNQGKAADANEILRHAIKDYPGEPEFEELLKAAERQLSEERNRRIIAQAIERGTALAKEGEFNEALACVEAALAEFPADHSLSRLREEIVSRQAVAAALSRAEDLLAARELDRALRIIEDALRRVPQEKLLLDVRTRIQGEISARERSDAVAKTIDTGKSLLETGRYQEAVSALQAALVRFPGVSAIVDLLRRAEHELREDQARREIERVRLEADAFLQRGQPERAIEMLETVTHPTPEIREILSRAKSALDERRRDESFREALRLCERSQFEEALAVLQRGVLQHGTSPATVELRERLERELEQRRKRETRERDLAALLSVQREIGTGAGRRRLRRAQREIDTLLTAHPEDAEIAEIGSRVRTRTEAALAPKPGGWKLPAAVAATLALGAGLFFAMRFAREKTEPVPVEVRTDPPGASVRLGNQSCITPSCRFDIKPGEYSLEASLRGYQALKRSVTIYTGKERHYMDFALEPLPPAPPVSPTSGTGTLTVKTGQPHTLVFVDNIAQKRTDESGSATLELPAGMHSVRVAKTGFQTPGEQRIAVATHETGILSFSLLAQPTSVDTQRASAEKSPQIPAPRPELATPPTPVVSSEAVEAQEWQHARSSGDPSVLRSFLAKYPGSTHATDAQAQIDDLDWSRVNTSDTQSLNGYLGQYPNGRHAREATLKIAELDWMNLDKGNEDALRGYISAHPNSTYRSQAEGLITELESRRAAARNEQAIPKDRNNVPLQGEGFNIASALDQFNQAFRRKQPRDVKKIWPSVPAEYTDAMRLSGSSYVMTLRPVDAAEVKGDTASIRCDLLITRTLRGKADQTKRSVKVRLQKVNGAWSILDPLGS